MPYACEKFVNLSTQDRIKEIDRLKLYRNCFSNNHNTPQCKSGFCCKSYQKHNTLLHIDTQIQTVSNHAHTQSASAHEHQSTPQTLTHQFAGNLTYGVSQVLLATAVTNVFNQAGERFTARVLLDSG